MALPRAARAKIHIARQQLNMDDVAYRALLSRVAGVDSSTALDERQAGRVLAEFERLGWKPQRQKNVGKPHNFSSDAMPLRITKIEAQLADMELPWSYADSIAKQMFGLEKMTFCRKPAQLDAIIAALHVEQERRASLARVEHLMAGLDQVKPMWRTDAKPWLPTAPNWRRHRPTLKRLIERLENLRAVFAGGQDISW